MAPPGTRTSPTSPQAGAGAAFSPRGFMTLLELLRAAKPNWDVLPPAREPVPGALGGFEAEADARWTVEMRDAAGSILALYAAVKACEVRIEAGRAPLRLQRKALISALRAFEG